jgi:adenine-specific DNA methylase
MAHSRQVRKQLGAFYTPKPIADALTDWAIREPSDLVLDPSFGGLVFLDAARTRLMRLGADEPSRGHIFGADIDQLAHEHSSEAMPYAHLVRGDFFELSPGSEIPLVSAVVGNPPYVRYQDWDRDQSQAFRVAQQAGVNFSRLASIWAPFVVHATSFLRPGGRLAFVLPAELLHAQYAKPVLPFLQDEFEAIGIAMFREPVFPGAQEEVVLVLADNKGAGKSRATQVVEFEDATKLNLGRLFTPRRGEATSEEPLLELVPRAARRLYRRLSDSSLTERLGTLASVDIGAVTGGNDYFLMNPADAPVPAELLRPAISKAAHLRGARFGQDDLEELTAAGARSYLLVADEDTSPSLLRKARKYLDAGELEGIADRYKCRVRNPWWAVPVPGHGAPQLYLTYCASSFPRIAANDAGALHTNTVHGVTMVNGLGPQALAAGFYNSLTLFSAELVGRSYGGGVLKLEPTEAEALLLPKIDNSVAELLPRVDHLIRTKVDLDQVLDMVDDVLLRSGIGLSDAEIRSLRRSGERLRQRRLHRARSRQMPKRRAHARKHPIKL